MKRLMEFQCVLSLLLLLALGLSSGVALAASTYTGGDSGKTITVGNGETFTVKLDENPTTGYSWNMTVGSGLEIVSDRYVPSTTSPNIVGSGGYHEWTIKAVSSGTHEISGIYKRPWEPVTGSEQSFNLKVKVVENGQGIGTQFPSFTWPAAFKLNFDDIGFRPDSMSIVQDFSDMFRQFPLLSMFI
jgi:inhibitor of cysteine peptidase